MIIGESWDAMFCLKQTILPPKHVKFDSIVILAAAEMEFNQPDVPLYSYRLPFLLDLLQVLSEIDANVHHHILGNEFPLARIVVCLVQDVQK